MRITIVGAGPAGLYVSACETWENVDVVDRDARISIYDSNTPTFDSLNINI
jgi:cation diffusion facilitator CzcD-associated flavoprotein CzcO